VGESPAIAGGAIGCRIALSGLAPISQRERTAR
jgi:hypothetical protein